MKLRNVLAAAAAGVALAAASTAQAALVLVGSWDLNDGPALNLATPITAQQVAAQLFGGAPEDYVISTQNSSANALAWYALLGWPGVTSIEAHDATSFLGFDLSAYVYDPALDDSQGRFVNYAFAERTTGPGIPEPATWALLIGGFGATGVVLRRRRTAAA